MPHLAVVHGYVDLGVRGSVVLLEIWNFEIIGDLDITDYAKLCWVYSPLCSFEAIQAVYDGFKPLFSLLVLESWLRDRRWHGLIAQWC